MDAVRNPFAPGAGSPPPELAGRSEILTQAKTTLQRLRLGRPSKSFLLVGLRGVGKTVLLNEVQKRAEDSGYRAFFTEVGENRPFAQQLVPLLRKLLIDLDRDANVNAHVKRALRTLKSFVKSLKLKIGDEIQLGVDLDPEPGSADSGDLEGDLADLFLAIGAAAASRRTAVALILDEMQYLNENELSALIVGVHRSTQKQHPLVLFGAGLPQLVGLAGRAKSYAERLFDFPEVGRLRPADARNALQEPAQREDVIFETDALDEIVRVTHGYPYFLQEWGYHCWDRAPSSPIRMEIVREASAAAIKRLDGSFFRVRFDRLTPREKDYLRAMAQLGPGPHRSGDIAELLSSDVRRAGPLRNGLIRKGMIYSPAHGDTAFTVPLFDEFMKRIMPKI